MNSLRFLRTFLAVSEYGSMAAAASRVSLTQAAVGQQMRALEEEFRRPLFDRAGRVVRLTPAGHALLPYVRRILSTYEEMLGAGSDSQEIAGTMTVGTIKSSMSFLLENILALKTRHPLLDVHVIHVPVPILAAQVKIGEIDAALLIVEDDMRRGLTWTPLFEEPLVLLASSRSASQQTDVKDLLRSKPFIRFNRITRTGREIESVLRRLRVKPNEILEVNTVETVMDLVRQDVGVSLAPKLRHIDWTRETSLIALELPKGTPARQIGLLENMLQPTKTTLLREQLLRALTK
ncbi:LysR family transcriptional regulator [Paraburkholderia sp. BCC1884]|uniref:LysR family transcriptional regulator n=1 Tax=Paraburkholderia sp. BCC1884 TaxID=2562668 RepID=UPI0011832E16|nr:LysR family transcriptional regulator [Paraburkholderia sp. BCC1884]